MKDNYELSDRRKQLVISLSGSGMDYFEIANRLRMTHEDVVDIDAGYAGCHCNDRGYN